MFAQESRQCAHVPVSWPVSIDQLRQSRFDDRNRRSLRDAKFYREDFRDQFQPAAAQCVARACIFSCSSLESRDPRDERTCKIVGAINHVCTVAPSAQMSMRAQPRRSAVDLIHGHDPPKTRRTGPMQDRGKASCNGSRTPVSVKQPEAAGFARSRPGWAMAPHPVKAAAGRGFHSRPKPAARAGRHGAKVRKARNRGSRHATPPTAAMKCPGAIADLQRTWQMRVVAGCLRADGGHFRFKTAAAHRSRVTRVECDRCHGLYDNAQGGPWLWPHYAVAPIIGWLPSLTLTSFAVRSLQDLSRRHICRGP